MVVGNGLRVRMRAMGSSWSIKGQYRLTAYRMNFIGDRSPLECMFAIDATIAPASIRIIYSSVRTLTTWQIETLRDAGSSIEARITVARSLLKLTCGLFGPAPFQIGSSRRCMAYAERQFRLFGLASIGRMSDDYQMFICKLRENGASAVQLFYARPEETRRARFSFWPASFHNGVLTR